MFLYIDIDIDIDLLRSQATPLHVDAPLMDEGTDI